MLFRSVADLAQTSAENDGSFSYAGITLDLANADNLYKAADIISSRLDNASVANNAVDFAFDKYGPAVDQLRSMFPGNAKWQSYIDNTVIPSKNISELRHAISAPTKTAIYIDAADNNANTYGGRVGNSVVDNVSKVALNKPIQSIKAIADIVGNTKTGMNIRNAIYEKQIAGRQAAPSSPDTGAQTFGQQLAALPGKALNTYRSLGSESGAAWPTTLSTIAGVLPQMTASSVMNPVSAPSTLEGAVAPGAPNAGAMNAMSGMNANYGQGYGTNFGTGYGSTGGMGQPQAPGIQTQWGYLTQTDIATGMMSALAAGDTASFNAMKQMYDIIGDMATRQQKASAGSSLNATQMNRLAQLDSAGSAIDRLESLFNDAGGAQGKIAGSISNFMSGIGANESVATYNDLASGLINQIGAAIGKTDSLNTEGEVQRALSLVPKVTDSKAQAARKLSELRILLGENKQNLMNYYYGDSDPLAGAVSYAN